MIWSVTPDNGVGNQQPEKDPELDDERNETGDHHGHRNHHPVKIHFAEQGGVRHKRRGGVVQTGCEIRPRHEAGHVEQKRRRSVSRQPGHPTEDHREGERRHQRLNDVPGRAEDRLLVDRHEVAPDEKADEIAIAPELVQAPVEPPSMWRNDGRSGRHTHRRIGAALRPEFSVRRSRGCRRSDGACPLEKT